MDKKCDCVMFKNRGICWHTGYKAPKLSIFAIELPAIARMKQRMMSSEEEKEYKNGYIQKG